MNIQELNKFLAAGNLEEKELFPHLERLKNAPFQFRIDFGLHELPKDPVFGIRCF